MDEEILTVLKEIKEKLDKPNKINILFVEDVAKILRINKNAATELLKREDVNSIKNCRKIKN